MIVEEFITYLGFEVKKLDEAQAAQRVMEKIATAGKAIAVTLTGAAVSIGFFANATANSVSKNKDLADSLGLSYDKMQDYQYALEKMGGSADEASGDLEKLQMMALRQGKSIDQVLVGLSESVEGQSSIGTKQLAENLGLSESSIKLLRQGGASVKEIMEEANKFGGKVSEESAKNSQKYVSEMNTLKRVITGNFQEAVAGALPAITQFITMMKDWIGENKELIKSNITNFIKGVTLAFTVMGAIVRVLFGAISGVLGLFFKFGGGAASVVLWAGLVSAAVAALAVILAVKFTTAMFAAVKGIKQFRTDFVKTYADIREFNQAWGVTDKVFGKMKLGLEKVAHGWKMVQKHPKQAAQIFAQSTLNGMKAVYQFVKTIITKGIPAVAIYTKNLIVAAALGIKAFAVSLFTVGIPAVWAFTAALLANPLVWIIAGIVVAIAAVVVAVVYLWKWFSKLMGATGSLGASLLIVGQTLMKAILMPVNQVTDAIVFMLNLLSKIPLVGSKFKGVADGIKDFQDKTNTLLTGDDKKYDITSRTKTVLAKAQSNQVSPARGNSNSNQVNNAKMEQTIYINGAANPNEVGRQVSDRTANSLQFISPGSMAPYGGF